MYASCPLPIASLIGSRCRNVRKMRKITTLLAGGVSACFRGLLLFSPTVGTDADAQLLCSSRNVSCLTPTATLWQAVF